MKPFDIKLAKAGHPVQTLCGKSARIVCYDRKSENDVYPIVALVEDIDSVEKPEFYTLDGKYISDKKSLLDLVMAPIKKEGWVNIFKNNVGTICSQIFGNETDANRAKDTYTKFLVTKKIEWEE